MWPKCCFLTSNLTNGSMSYIIWLNTVFAGIGEEDSLIGDGALLSWLLAAPSQRHGVEATPAPASAPPKPHHQFSYHWAQQYPLSQAARRALTSQPRKVWTQSSSSGSCGRPGGLDLKTLTRRHTLIRRHPRGCQTLPAQASAAGNLMVVPSAQGGV